jgi:hypothetical protein
LIEKVAAAVVAKGMATPAIFLLESSKPLSFLGSQALHFLEPFVRSLFDTVTYTRVAKALEDRKNVERLLVRVEALEDEAQERARAEREKRKAEKRSRT